MVGGVVFCFKWGVPEPWDGHPALCTPCLFQLLVLLSCTSIKMWGSMQGEGSLQKHLNQNHYPNLTEADRIKCLSQDKNLRSFWPLIVYGDHTPSLAFQTSIGPEWLPERNRSPPQLLHSQSRSHKLITSFKSKGMPVLVSRCQLRVWQTFKIAWAAAISETQQPSNPIQRML